jgi:hypothetical protein
MPGLHRLVAAGLAVAAVCTSGPARAGELFRDTVHKYVLEVPDGWEVVPPKDMAVLHQATRPDDPDKPYILLAAFRRVGTVGIPTRGRQPLALVTVLPTDKPDMTFAEFEKEITRVFTRRDARGWTNLRAPLAFDETRKRVTVQTTHHGVGEYDAGFLGKEEVIVLQCAAEERTFKDHQPAFEKLADSFRFEDPGAQPAADQTTALDKMLKTNLGPNGQMVAIGIGVTVVVLVLGVVFMRGKPDRHRSSGY